MTRPILFCTQTASPIGGVESWLDRLCHELGRGWRPVVALVRGARAHRPEVFRDAHPGLETVEIDGRGLDAEGRIRAVMRCLRRVRPAVFVPLTVRDAHDAICRSKLAGGQARYLLTVRGNSPPQIADARRYRDFVDLAVCPGRLTCRLVEWAGLGPERIRHVPHGASPAMVAHRARKPGDALRLGYVGRLTEDDKRILDLVPLARDLEQQRVPFSLVVAGSGPARGRLEQELAWLGDRAEFVGPQSREALYRSIYPRLDCLVLFSPSEAFGLVLVEAMMNGVVPVSSRFLGHAAEGILKDGATALLFSVGQPAAAAACLRRFSEEPGLLDDLAERARAHAEARFTWEASLEGWRRAFDDVLALPRRCGASLPLVGGVDGGRMGWAPAALRDVVRRARRRIVGIPPGMIGGEEWPWVSSNHDPDLLASIERVARTLDRGEEPESASGAT